MTMMISGKIFLTAGLPVVSAVVYLLCIGYRQRSIVNKLRKQGIAMPAEWSWFTGHLLILKKYVDRLPPDANVYLAMRDLAREFQDTEMFLMDFWPVFPPVLMCFSPEAATQASNTYNLQKTDKHKAFMKPVIGGPSLVSMNDQEWKTWRALFNPGFSASSMNGYIPALIDSAQVFCEELKARAGSKDLVFLDELTTRLTMDVIIKVTLDQDLDNQRTENVLATSLRHIVTWHSFWDPRILLNPLRPFVQGYYGYVMNTYIRNKLDQRFAEMIQETSAANANIDLVGHKPKRAKSILALAIEAYIKQNQEKLQSSRLDDHFARYATYQIRLFLFAGNDTTSSSIVYTYHTLAKNPDVLSQLRHEHDAVFGKDPARASVLLREDPALLNQCPYTLAVIKETLRLYPPSSSLRQGRPGISLTDRHGSVYPTEHLGITIMHPVIHINERLWPRAGEFLPERWLVESGHDLYPNMASYRPFEHGPRSCIGQTLVYNEMRIVLIMTIRTLNIQPAYDEFDALKRKSMGYTERFLRFAGLKGDDLHTVEGERAYQTDKAGTHPADSYPCRVTLADHP